MAVVDRDLLRRRAEAAAEAAALRYKECCGGLVRCKLVGQLRFKSDDWPRPSDCERDPQHWKLPHWVDRISLLFKWDIMEKGCVVPVWSDNSVVTLNNAEQHGVPLPEGWERVIKDVADRVAVVAGAT